MVPTLASLGKSARSTGSQRLSQSLEGLIAQPLPGLPRKIHDLPILHGLLDGAEVRLDRDDSGHASGLSVPFGVSFPDKGRALRPVGIH